jgi:hypothetical protein
MLDIANRGADRLGRRKTVFRCDKTQNPAHFRKRCAKYSTRSDLRDTTTLRPAAITAVCLSACIGAVWISRPSLDWPDRRPIGALFLADHTHGSAKNPRGWFNDPAFDVHGPVGMARFRQAILAYAERSIAILQRSGAQGMIVWDLEGEEFAHKTTYIGDPRSLRSLAPEMADAADDFFKRFRDAGLRVGVTIRPQELLTDAAGDTRQVDIWNYDRLLLEKIDYARDHWGATLFYIDSNGGPLWPAEVVRLRRVARRRPDILLIPEHHDTLYYAFSAPYGSIPKGAGPTTRAIRILYPHAFQVLAVPDSDDEAGIRAAAGNGDVLLFPAWFDNPVARLVGRLSRQ